MQQNKDFIESILKERYYLDYENSWEQVSKRISVCAASAGIYYSESLREIKENEKKFYKMISEKDFIPNSPTIFNIGRNVNKKYFSKKDLTIDDYKEVYKSLNECLSACFVLPIEDSMEGIFNTKLEAALVTKAGGGVGIDFSPIRPRNSVVKSTGKVASGPVSFIRTIDADARAVRQGGMRRGAFMAILDYNHPDILEFIQSKLENTGSDVLSFFNLSVDIDHEKFSHALKNNEYIELTHSETGFVKKIKADELLHLMAETAWRKGCPGIYMSSKQNKYFANSNNRPIDSTNACGEQGLPAYGNCTLGHLNLGKIEIGKELVFDAILFLDNIVTINKFPKVGKFDETNEYFRNVGLGVMGVADMLINKKIPYQAPEACFELAKTLGMLTVYSYEASMSLAKKRGKCPAFDESRWVEEKDFIPIAMETNDELKELNELLLRTFDKVRATGLRNIMVNTIAPTGTTSIIAGTTGGIEPHFSFMFERAVVNKDGESESTTLIPEIAYKVLDKKTLETLAEKNKSVYEMTKNELFRTAHEIAPIAHLTMQHFAQSYIDNSISKTINLPESASVDDVYQIMKFAIFSNCKGITIYRDGSYKDQVFKKTSFVLHTRKLQLDGEDLFVNFTNTHKGNAPLSVRCQENSKFSDMVDLLNSVLSSKADAIQFVSKGKGKLLEALYELTKSVNNFEERASDSVKERIQDPKGFLYDEDGILYCPSCGCASTIVMGEGCVSCKKCGWGACL